ncbi:MAG: SRPBCC family protein [Acidimicrobiia bacterium]|nr:SRPBCC family protein [Acidimicrobiia bacterium]
MPRLKEQITVSRDQDEAFAYTADFANIEQWDPGVARSSRTSGGPLGVGSSFDLLVKFGSRTLPMTYRITEYEPSSRVVLEGVGDKIQAVDEITFASTDVGTAITYIADLNFGGVMRWVAPLLRPMLDRVGKKAVAGLAAALDS